MRAGTRRTPGGGRGLARNHASCGTTQIHDTRHPDGDAYEVPPVWHGPLSTEERARGLAGVRAARDVLEHLAVAS